MLFDSHCGLLTILLTVIMLYSATLSSVQSIDNYTEKNHLLHRLVYQMHESILRGNHITISWVPSRVGICGNESADQAAREAAMRPAEFIPVPYRDWFPLIKEKKVLSLEWILANRRQRADNFEGEARKVKERDNEIEAKWRSSHKQVMSDIHTYDS